jgi:hypothetical protein
MSFPLQFGWGDNYYRYRNGGWEDSPIKSGSSFYGDLYISNAWVSKGTKLGTIKFN